MIKAGDIVFQVRKGGLFNKQPVTDRLGLVIKEHREKGAIPQFYVQFNQEDPRWYYQHDLEKIRFGKDNKNEY
jgi:hypothetical protein|tara:strand:- start:205 stop:423 length:219 start_codon:yes stop_codon:yes gene_type:complete